MAGMNTVRVPYKGAGPALLAVMTGGVHAMFGSAGGAAPYVKSGRLRALATTGEKRAPSLPELPTVIEAGVPGFEISTWFGVLAPAGTAKPRR